MKSFFRILKTNLASGNSVRLYLSTTESVIKKCELLKFSRSTIFGRRHGPKKEVRVAITQKNDFQTWFFLTLRLQTLLQKCPVLWAIFKFLNLFLCSWWLWLEIALLFEKEYIILRICWYNQSSINVTTNLIVF